MNESATLDVFRTVVQLLTDEGRVDEVVDLFDSTLGINMHLESGEGDILYVQLMDTYSSILSDRGRRIEAKDVLRLVVQVSKTISII